MCENCKRERHTQLVISFKNTTAAMEMESRAKSENIYGRIIPLPSKISAGCGLAWKTEPDMRNETINFMQKEKFSGMRYMNWICFNTKIIRERKEICSIIISI